jgi:hypothetical protein
MKQLCLLALALLVSVAPAAAQSPLYTSANDRQTIMELEYQLNQPGVPPARQTQLESQITAIETKINTNGEPNLAVPEYGSCDADRGLIQYLQDELTTDIDYQQQVDDNRQIHDLNAILKAKAC